MIIKNRMVLFLVATLSSISCSNSPYTKTVDHVDLKRFSKKWYVIAGRFTFLEKGAHNAVEEYTFNQKEQKIDINFYFNKDSFDGTLKKIPQKAWIENQETNAYWKVSPFWPLKFDYLVIALAEDYSWTAIGVPSQKYLWIMADKWDVSEEQLEIIIKKVNNINYSVQDIVRIPQKW